MGNIIKINIALNPMDDGDLNISLNDRNNLAWLSDSMPTRDANIEFPGYKYPGVMKSWSIVNNPVNSRHELCIEIQLGDAAEVISVRDLEHGNIAQEPRLDLDLASHARYRTSDEEDPPASQIFDGAIRHSEYYEVEYLEPNDETWVKARIQKGSPADVALNGAGVGDPRYDSIRRRWRKIQG